MSMKMVGVREHELKHGQTELCDKVPPVSMNDVVISDNEMFNDDSTDDLTDPISIGHSLIGRIKLVSAVDSRKSKICSSGTPSVRSALSKRLTKSSIVIPERDNPSLVRIYRYNSRLRNSSTVYYRCSTCDTKWRKQGSFDESVPKRKPYVKTVDGEIVGDPYPKHHPTCEPVSAQEQQVQDIERACRMRVKEGFLQPKQAYDIGKSIARQSLDDSVCTNRADTVFPEWKRLSKRYRILSRKNMIQNYPCSSNSKGQTSDSDVLSKLMDEKCCDASVFSQSKQELHNVTEQMKQFASSIVVSERDQQMVRVYRYSGKSRDGITVYYRCSRCDSICRKFKGTGKIDGLIRASLKTVNGRIVGNRYPQHHGDCYPIAMDTLNSQEKNLNKGSNTMGEDDANKTRCEIVEELQLNNADADIYEEAVWDSEDLRHDVANCEVIVASEEIPQSASMESDIIDVIDCEEMGPILPSDSFESCSCRRYLEANLAVRDDILRYLNEMRLIRAEIKHMLEIGRNYDDGVQEYILE